MARVASAAMSTTSNGTPPALTQRQLQVVGLIALGCSNEEVGRRLGISARTADRLWAFARVWLLREISGDPSADPTS